MQRRYPSKFHLCASALLAAAVMTAGAGNLVGGQGDAFTEAERKAIASLSLAALPPLPADSTNEAIGNPTAMALGATLFFDMRMSKNGAVACSTCHQIGRQFQDGIPLGKGIGTMNRRTQPLAGVAWQRWFFWDGRKDSLWSQALAPLEKPVEHGLTRAWYAHFIAENFRDRYERIFGPMPDLAGVPRKAGPLGDAAERTAWQEMSEIDREAVNRVFVTIGKMIAAFERSIVPEETRFDRFAAALGGGKEAQADASLSDQEITGLRLFVGKANCVACHSGPRLTDDAFHNTGVPPLPGLPQDLGREQGLAQLAADEFNCHGRFGDPSGKACPAPQSALARDRETTRAYKTPSLRGVAERPPYMHAGQFDSLERVLEHYSEASVSGRSEVKPLHLSASEKAALVAFLRTLER